MRAAKNGNGKHAAPVPGGMVSREDARALADSVAKTMLGVPDRHTAFKQLDAGKHRGTIAEAELRMLRTLCKE